MTDTSTTSSAAFYTVVKAIEAIGRGFDVNFEPRLLYCKGVSRIIEVDESDTRDLYVYGGLSVANIAKGIKCSQEGVSGRETACASNYFEMVEYFNKRAELEGTIPLGSFNSVFSFTGSKEVDSAATKCLAVDGYFIPLCKVQLAKSPFELQTNVKRAIPSSWNPSALASFIEAFGTHVITSVTVGGKDVIYVKQHQSSPLSVTEIKSYVQGIGDQRYSDSEIPTTSGPMKSKDNSQGIHPQPTSTAHYLTGKEDVTVIFRRRGGDDLVQSHAKWETTVQNSPDVIEMTFYPITDLLDGAPSDEHIIRAFSLYLEYKPPIEELRYFLEYQILRVWAPVEDTFLSHQRKDPVCPFLQFSIMGQKLYVCQEQVSVGRKPVTGMKLYLAGLKQNRLTVQLQHFVSLPKILKPYWESHVAIGAPKWHGPEEQDSRWFEPVKWKNFSHVSTAPIEHHDTFIGDLSGVHIVTGAQLGVWDFGSRNVLYMKLLYSRIPQCTIRRSLWDNSPFDKTKKSKSKSKSKSKTVSGESSNGNSSSGKQNVNKLTKIVDMSEMSKGPQNSPGHWLVTGGKLGVENGKIIIRVKYSLLNY